MAEEKSLGNTRVTRTAQLATISLYHIQIDRQIHRHLALNTNRKASGDRKSHGYVRAEGWISLSGQRSVLAERRAVDDL